MSRPDVDDASWRDAGALFHEIVDLAPAEQERILSRWPPDAPVRRALEALVRGDRRAPVQLPYLRDPREEVAAPHEDPLALVGTRLAQFEVRAHVACGGMGVVYRAFDHDLSRFVALKVLPLLAGAKATQEHMLAEARAAGALDHPHVCALFGIGACHAGPFLIMPWYDGETLRQRLQRGPLPLPEVLRIGAELASAVAAAHAAGLVHRDIKPGNVMLLPTGTVKLLDFGLARPLSSIDDLNSGAGTRAYMAPEQRSQGPVDTRADLWALGAVLRAMAAGNGHEAATTLPDDVQALVERLMAPEAAHRGPPAAELAAWLASRASGEPAAGHTAAGRRSRRRRYTTITALAVAALGALGLSLSRRPSSRGALVHVVLADMEVVGADSALRRFGTAVLREQLAQSPSITLASRERVDSVKVRMRELPNAALAGADVRHVAQRLGAAITIDTRLSATGNSYLLTAALTQPRTGAVLATVQERAARGDADLVDALQRLSLGVRRAIGESDADLRSTPALPALTTHSVVALQALQAARPLLHSDPREATTHLQRAVRADSTFAYSYLVMANGLAALPVRTAARDTALSRAYRFREALSLMEHSQATAFYFWLLALDRQRAVHAFESAIAEDSTQTRAMMNLTAVYMDHRAFGRAERWLLRARTRDSVLPDFVVPTHVRLLLATGRVAAARAALDGYLAQYPALRGSPLEQRTRVEIALATRAYRDTSLSVASPSVRAAIARTEGRLRDARRFDARADSLLAEALDDNLVAYRPLFRSVVREAAALLWVARQPAQAVVVLDGAFAARVAIRETEDRLDALRAAALFAAAGRPTRARRLIRDATAGVTSTLVRRALASAEQTALGEVALAEGRSAEAMEHFQRGDLAADGLPATRCSTCVLPYLARALDRAGQHDSARVLWTRYVDEPALDRVTTDQWFLSLARERAAADRSGDRGR